ncbi:DNA-3-methyladenine glycosylase I [Cesiribacter andamanensis]|uniref:DNA-3-methyladenine glycosylase 1 n=1 Tax=Cesiribacter andamanensis AMV16 TaxID=1279009 RepID=M7NH73_9BACT|nr:DNA-3-methyladenine glycosylase I [Cesiribacter andamanensis]EMR01165.1 DNA-3-methyladenine glycosylase 1 [Cesiribacter andamanensis AMV16]
MEELNRCQWVSAGWAGGKFPEYQQYHDQEWGVPVHDDRVHFEFLVLESAQAGLSWATVLRKRAAYREAFARFDPQQVAAFGEEKVQELLQNGGIIRNGAKIRAAISNAQRFLDIQQEWGSFSAYIWEFVGGRPLINHWTENSQVPATSPQSDALAADMKKRGFKFLGSTVLYAHLQACGLVMDHTTSCYRYAELSTAKAH